MTAVSKQVGDLRLTQALGLGQPKVNHEPKSHSERGEDDEYLFVEYGLKDRKREGDQQIAGPIYKTPERHAHRARSLREELRANEEWNGAQADPERHHEAHEGADSDIRHPGDLLFITHNETMTSLVQSPSIKWIAQSVYV